jgi:drug/metabolite transporter (DMT)-like permease
MLASSATGSVRAHLILILGATCVSFAPILVKAIGTDVGLTAIGFWRMSIGGLALFLLAALLGRPLTLSAAGYRWAVLAGFLFFLDLTVWHRSIMYAGAGMSTVLANTQVFATAVFGYLLFREKLSLRFWAAAVSAIGGVTLLVGVAADISFDSVYLRGIAYGLLTGMVYASYLITLKRAGQSDSRPDYITFMAWTAIFSSLFLGVKAAFESGAFFPTGAYSLGVLILLALIVQALGWWAIFSSLSQLEASRTGLILLLQPTLATVWGVLIFAEYLTISQVAGAVITLTAIYIGSAYRRAT